MLPCDRIGCAALFLDCLIRGISSHSSKVCVVALLTSQTLSLYVVVYSR